MFECACDTPIKTKELKKFQEHYATIVHVHDVSGACSGCGNRVTTKFKGVIKPNTSPNVLCISCKKDMARQAAEEEAAAGG